MSGVQPEADGRLKCLECGNWYRLLPPHLGAAHQMSATQYREAHQLPRQLGLRGRDLADAASRQGRARYIARPDIRETMERGRTLAPATSAVRSSQETSRRPGVVAARRRGGQGKAAAARERVDQAARQLGFVDLADFFAARCAASQPVTAMALDLGVARATVSAWLHRLRADGSIDTAATAARRARQVAYLRALLNCGAGGQHAAACASVTDEVVGQWRQDDATFAAAAEGLRAFTDSMQARPGRPATRRGAGREPADQTLTNARRQARRSAYLRELLESGTTHVRALAAVGISRATLTSWRRNCAVFDTAVEAIRQYGVGPGERAPRRDHRYRTSEAQFEAHLAALEQGLGPNEAAERSGATRSAVTYRAQHDPQFAARLHAIRPPRTGQRGPQPKPLDETWLRTAWDDPTISRKEIAAHVALTTEQVGNRARALQLGDGAWPKRRRRRPMDKG